MTRGVRLALGLVSGVLAIGAALSAFAVRPELGRGATWQQLASPGPLSASHAFLGDQCAACHTPVRGVEAASCIACHANETGLLGREPTAFHAGVQSCRECHAEHGGGSTPPRAMDHAALAAIGLRTLREGSVPAAGDAKASAEILGWLDRTRKETAAAGPVGPEAALDCAACHSNQDQHRGYFGRDCLACHGTATWSIARFRHPPQDSRDCAQCHIPPPSHTMMHFEMVSAEVAGHHGARVEQCYLCHQTTSWNDIRGVGYYKHH